MKDVKSGLSNNAVVMYAAGVGCLLAWWNICHEDGMLFFSEWASRMFSCMASCSGGLVVFAVMAVLSKKERKISARMGVFAAVAMLAVEVALDACSPAEPAGLIAALQLAASVLTFGCIVAASTVLEGVGTKALGQTAVCVLAFYCASEFAVFAAYGLSGSDSVRGILHAVVLTAGMSLLIRAMFGGLQQRGGNAVALSARPSFLSLGHRGIPWQFVIHVLAYSTVFGVTHALASGVVPANLEKMAACYIGTGAASLVMFAMLRGRDESETVWPLLRQYVFPLGMLSFVLLPFANMGAVFVSVAVAECAMDAYFVFLMMFAVLTARKIGLAAEWAVAASLALAAVGLTAGAGVGSMLHIVGLLAPITYNILTAAALVLLCLGTFWVGNDKQVFYAWGLEKRLTPKRFAEKRLEERCSVVAKEYGLTNRETEILIALAQKMTPRDIADRNFIALNTVRTHIARIHRKTQTHNQREVDALIATVEVKVQE